MILKIPDLWLPKWDVSKSWLHREEPDNPSWKGWCPGYRILLSYFYKNY
jgi:hypothetical protein